MWRFGYDANASFILTVALVALLGTVLVWQQHRTGKTILIWFWSAFFGVLLGFAGTFALIRISNSTLLHPTIEVAAMEVGGETADAPGDAAGSGGEGQGAGGGFGGGFGGGPGGGGGFGGPRPKRDLTSAVRKMALLTGEIGLALSADQASAIAAALKDIEQSETMTDDEAQAKYDELIALLDEKQKEQMEAIGLPRGPRPSGGPGGGEQPAEDANPFGQEMNMAALLVLRQRFGQQ